MVMISRIPNLDLSLILGAEGIRFSFLWRRSLGRRAVEALIAAAIRGRYCGPRGMRGLLSKKAWIPVERSMAVSAV